MITLAKFYLHLFIRRIPLLAAIVGVFAVLGIAYATSLPDEYSAEARLLVEPPQIPEELASSTVDTAIAEDLQLIQNRLLTRANFIDIANKFNVFPPNEEGERRTPNQVVAAMRAATSVRTSSRRGQASFIDISFTGSDPNIAAAVVNEFVTRTLNDNIRVRTERAGDTLDFFEQEVDRLTTELARQSGAISQFKADNSGTLPEALNFRLNRQSNLEERLTALQREIDALEDQRARVIAVYEETGQLRTPDSDLTPEQRQLQTLESELASALAVYSENNPRVVVLKTRIDQLRQVVEGQTPSGDGPKGPSIYEVTLAEIDASSRTLRVEVEDVEAELAKLALAIDATPRTAIALEALERDYAIVQRQYDAAVAGLARARTGEQIELNAQGQRITIVESAVAPDRPTSPNRRVISLAGGMAGLAVAAGVFAILELLNGAIRRPGELVNRVGITPIATIPYIPTQKQVARRKFQIVALFLLVFVVVPVCLYLVHTQVVSLGDLVVQIRGLI